MGWLWALKPLLLDPLTLIKLNTISMLRFTANSIRLYNYQHWMKNNSFQKGLCAAMSTHVSVSCKWYLLHDSIKTSYLYHNEWPETILLGCVKYWGTCIDFSTPSTAKQMKDIITLLILCSEKSTGNLALNAHELGLHAWRQNLATTVNTWHDRTNTKSRSSLHEPGAPPYVLGYNSNQPLLADCSLELL